MKLRLFTKRLAAVTIQDGTSILRDTSPHISNPILELSTISKRFGATQALTEVSMAIEAGKIHALLGENGAGKSTLIKIITGVYRPDAGEIKLDGVTTHLGDSAQAQRRGIAAIYQEPLLFPDLSVAENIFISHQGRGEVMHWNKLFAEAEEILKRLGVSLDVRSPASGLTLAAQQSVEIAKAISMKVRILVLDEPTASLSVHEANQLLQIMRDLRSQGVAILFISHRMDEVFDVADTITTFRDGRLISTKPRCDVSAESAVSELVGRDVVFEKRAFSPVGECILKVRKLNRVGRFQDIEFDLHRGEILGFSGLIGAGRTDVGLALFGIAPATTGSIELNGKSIRPQSPTSAIEEGIAYVSEDRRKLGLSLPMSITQNITLPTLQRYSNSFGIIDTHKERSSAEGFRKRMRIRAASVEVPVGKLSGGNQQKVMLAKWINSAPKILILDEPTRGIDINAKSEVHQMIAEIAMSGVGIILISSDLTEVLSLSDRILVMREGTQTAILHHDEATQESVMMAALGQSSQQPERFDA